MKQKIKIAGGRPTPKVFSRNHYTTLGFGVPFPIFVEEVSNKDKVNIRVQNFSRLAPMVLPNLGTLELKLHAFYVPFRLVWNHFENFREGLPCWNSKGSQVYKRVPCISDYSLTQYFLGEHDENLNTLVEDVQSASFPFDIVIVNGTTTNYYKFTAWGKEVYHTLLSLGYNFKFVASEQQSTTYSALPLLCYFKIFLDYFIPSQLQPSSAIHRLFCEIHDKSAADIYDDLDNYLLSYAFTEIRLYYQNNYFTSAWLNPNAPVPGLVNIGQAHNDKPVINSIQTQTSSGNNSKTNQMLESGNNFVMRFDNSSGTSASKDSVITADGITFMQKFAAFIKRSNFAGSRSVERILARFGVHVDDFQIGLSKYLGSETLELQKSDVTVTGNTEQAGEFVGKGFFSGGQKRQFKVNCDLSGMIFVTASLQPPSTYVTGVRRRNLHMTPLDFYTPEFDGSLMQGISGCEVDHRFLVSSPDFQSSIQDLGLTYSHIYGFTPRYSEYAGNSIDDVTGDFAVPTLQENIDSFILPRRLYNISELNAYLRQGNTEVPLRDFMYNPIYQDADNAVEVNPINDLYSNDSWQFNRIFKDITGNSDPVFSVFKIDCIINSLKLPLNQSAEIIGRGSEIEFETNGVHLS